ncbi:hypothetical protein Bca4012_000310 [Brassica carinata]
MQCKRKRLVLGPTNINILNNRTRVERPSRLHRQEVLRRRKLELFTGEIPRTISTTKPLHHHIRTGNKLFHHEQPSPHLESLRNTYGSTKHQRILNRLQSIHRHLEDMSEIEIERLEN